MAAQPQLDPAIIRLAVLAGSIVRPPAAAGTVAGLICGRDDSIIGRHILVRA